MAVPGGSLPRGRVRIFPQFGFWPHRGTGRRVARRNGPVDRYLFSVVGTSRCDVRAACSGATPSIANVARKSVPPATSRAGTAQRAIPTIAKQIRTVPVRSASEERSGQKKSAVCAPDNPLRTGTVRGPMQRDVPTGLNRYPASCRQSVLSRIVSLCRQDAGSTLN